MIIEMIDRFKEIEPKLLSKYKEERPSCYDDILKDTLTLMFKRESYNKPDPSNIHVIDDGNYQGTRLFIIPEIGYQPSRYWSVKVYYGSCSGCDTFEANVGWGEAIEESEAKGNVTMALHMIEEMKEI